MVILAQTKQQANVSLDSIFALWADINNWAEYDKGIEWAKISEDFKVGSHYTIKPKGGPKVKATIMVIEPGKRFVDASHLLGAKLTFDHMLSQQDSITTVEVIMTIAGPLSWLWSKILGKNQQADLDTSTANLIAKAKAS